MKAMILAAGEGRRLRPLTLTRPKPMLPIGGRPLLEHNIRLLRAHGIREIAINLHYLPQAITDYFGDGKKWDVALHYSYEETLLGSAGALKKIESFFDETSVVLYGDLFTTVNLEPLIERHRALGAQVTMAVHEVDNPQEKGVVLLDDQGWVKRFVEKPGPDHIFSNLVNAGVYVLEPDVLSWIPPGTPYDFGHHLFPWLLENGKRLAGHPIDDLLIDIGNPASYERAQQWVSQASFQAANYL